MSWRDPAARPAAGCVPFASRTLSPGICGSLQEAVPQDVLAKQAGCGSGCSHSPGSCLFLAVGAHTPAACVWLGADAADGFAVSDGAQGSSRCSAVLGWSRCCIADPWSHPWLQLLLAAPLPRVPHHSCLLKGDFGDTSTEGSALTLLGM